MEKSNLGWDEEIKSKLGGFGKNVFIGKYCSFANPEQVFLGNNVRIDPYCHIMTGLSTGDNVQIMAQAVLSGGSQQKITLGDWTFIGYGSKLFCASEDYSGEHGVVNEYWGENKIHRGNIIFNDYAGVASDVIIMPGVVLPEGCAIGAKSFVYKSEHLYKWAVFAGNPLKFFKRRLVTKGKLKDKWK